MNIKDLAEDYFIENLVADEGGHLARFGEIAYKAGVADTETRLAVLEESAFKRQFVIQWLAAIEAVNYQDNCSRGWKDNHPPVEDAFSLADSVWDKYEALTKTGAKDDE